MAAIVCTALVATLVPEHGRAADRSPAICAALVLRILAYDRRPKGAQSGSVRLVLVHRADEDRSTSICRELSHALAGLAADRALRGRALRIDGVAYRDGSELPAVLAQPAAALLVCGGLRAEVQRIAAATRSAGVLSISVDEADVRAGIAIGLVRSDARTKILVNLGAATAEGAVLDAGLLGLAEVLPGVGTPR